jgi:RNA polymerase sigma-70 factor (ECF subfamily)
VADSLVFEPNPETRQEGPATSEDAALIEGLRTFSEEAYETLVSRFQEPVYNLVYRLLGNSPDACDVVQEVFLKVFRNIKHFRGGSTLKTWIYRIAVNEAHNHRRWFFRHRRQEVGLEDEREGCNRISDTLAARDVSPFDYVFDREKHVMIERALAHLNPTFREAVVLRDISDLSYEEIAEVLQVSLGTVKSRILRGREAMRQQLAGRLQPEPALEWSPQPAEWRHA